MHGRRTETTVRYTAIVVSLLVLTTACGSGSSSPTTTAVPPTGASDTSAPAPPPTDGSTGAPASAPLTASFTGVTPDTITIAVVSVDFDKLRDVFGVDLDYQDPELVMKPLIDELNANGGINGRTINAIYRKFLPVGATDADRVCIEVTEDIGVFAVFGGFVGPGAQEVNLCLTETHNTMLIGLPGTAEQYARSTAPWIVDGMGQRRQSLALVSLLADQNLLADKVAIWSSNSELCPLVPDVKDALEAAGSEVVFTGAQSAPASDFIASDDEYRLILDKAQAEGVGAVYWLGNGLSPPKLHATDAPDIAIYDPFADQLVGALRDVPDIDKVTFYGTGTFPKVFREDPLLDRCISIVEAATDIVVQRPEDYQQGQPDWYQDVTTNCEQLEIFRLAATAAGPNLTNDTFLAAAESLGTVALPGEVAASIRPGKYDVSDATGLVRFDATANGKGDFVPIGPTKVFD